MRSLIASVVLIATAATLADAQGYYQNQLRRNPYTGRLEVVRSGGDYRSAVPYRAYRDGQSFGGADFNPYSGTAATSQVRRDPVTGRVDVANEYYNPWTGARMETQTRFNPFTRRYETVQRVLPPSRLPAEDAAPVVVPSEQLPPDQADGQPVEGATNGRVQTKVIETFPNETAPLPPAPGDVDGGT